MTLTKPFITVLVAIIASLFGYLLYAPHSEGIAQLNKVRLLTAPMRLVHLIVCLCLLFL